MRYKNRRASSEQTMDLQRAFKMISKKSIFSRNMTLSVNMDEDTFMHTIVRAIIGDSTVVSDNREKQRLAREQARLELILQEAKSKLLSARANGRSARKPMPIPAWADSYALYLMPMPNLGDNEDLDGALERGTCVVLTRRPTGIYVSWLDGPKTVTHHMTLEDDIHDLRLYGDAHNIPVLRDCVPGHHISLQLDQDSFIRSLSDCGLNGTRIHGIIKRGIEHAEWQRRRYRETGWSCYEFKGFKFTRALSFDNIEIDRACFNAKIGSAMANDLLVIDMAMGKSRSEADVCAYLEYKLRERQTDDMLDRKRRDDADAAANAAAQVIF